VNCFHANGFHALEKEHRRKGLVRAEQGPGQYMVWQIAR
jgi:hypothetical protein